MAVFLLVKTHCSLLGPSLTDPIPPGLKQLGYPEPWLASGFRQKSFAQILTPFPKIQTHMFCRQNERTKRLLENCGLLFFTQTASSDLRLNSHLKTKNRMAGRMGLTNVKYRGRMASIGCHCRAFGNRTFDCVLIDTIFLWL